MNLIILASGKGTRLGLPLPKPMCVFENKTLLRHVRDTISVTPSHVAVTCLKKHLTGRDRILFKKYMLQEYPEITSLINVPKARGSGDALLRTCGAVDWSLQEPVMVVPCDITGIKYSREDFTAPFIWTKEATSFSGTESKVITDTTGDVRAIDKKLKSSITYIGVSGYPSLSFLLKYLNKAQQVNAQFSTTDVIRELIYDNHRISALENQYIFDIGTPEGQHAKLNS